MDSRLTPSCPLGMTRQDLIDLFGERIDDFMQWLSGQTAALCNGEYYNYDQAEFFPTECADAPHGLVVYTWDVERYLAGWPVID